MVIFTGSNNTPKRAIDADHNRPRATRADVLAVNRLVPSWSDRPRCQPRNRSQKCLPETAQGGTYPRRWPPL